MIYIFGDSHRNFLTQSPPGCGVPVELDIFRSYSVGPGTAHNYYENRFPETLRLLEIIPKTNFIILNAGEIDCRMHIPGKWQEEGGDLLDFVERTVNNLMKCYLHLRNLGYNIITWGPHPTRKVELLGYTYYVSDQKTRNQSCEMFNEVLQYKSLLYNIPFATLYYDIITSDYDVHDEYYSDSIHLNGLLWPKARKILGEIYDNHCDI